MKHARDTADRTAKTSMVYLSKGVNSFIGIGGKNLSAIYLIYSFKKVYYQLGN